MKHDKDQTHNFLQRFPTIFPIGKKSWKDRARAAVLIGLAVFAQGAIAHPGHETSHQSSQVETPAVIPFVDLGVIDSKPGETKNNYMLRVGAALDRFTTQSGHEGCGAIMAKDDGNGWRVRLITNRSQIGCVRMVFDEDGYSLTDETIHSHPRPGKGGKIAANARDQFLRGFQCGQVMGVVDREFSEGDLKNGAGYLVARGRLLYQRDGWTRNIGKVDPEAALDDLVLFPTPQGSMTRNNEVLSMQVLPSSVSEQAKSLSWSNEDIEGFPTLRCAAPRTPPAK